MALAGRQLQKSGAGSTGGFTSAKVVEGLSEAAARAAGRPPPSSAVSSRGLWASSSSAPPSEL